MAKSNAELDDYFRNNLQYIRQVHIHDCREASGKITSHRVVGTGRIDFLNYFNILQGADVLDYCIEVRPKEKALESLIALKKMIMYA